MMFLYLFIVESPRSQGLRPLRCRSRAHSSTVGVVVVEEIRMDIRSRRKSSARFEQMSQLCTVTYPAKIVRECIQIHRHIGHEEWVRITAVAHELVLRVRGFGCKIVEVE